MLRLIFELCIDLKQYKQGSDHAKQKQASVKKTHASTISTLGSRA
jgi:hypothetical protein